MADISRLQTITIIPSTTTTTAASAVPTTATSTSSYHNVACNVATLCPLLPRADDDSETPPPLHLAAQTRGAVFGLADLSHIEARH